MYSTLTISFRNEKKSNFLERVSRYEGKKHHPKIVQQIYIEATGFECAVRVQRIFE